MTEAMGVNPKGLQEILQQTRDEPLPPPEAREPFFMNEVARAEQLAASGTSLTLEVTCSISKHGSLAGPASYLESALCFYRALRVYPSQMELLMIYQKSVPEPILMVGGH